MFAFSGFAQVENHNIVVEVKNYEKDFVVLGYYYGDRQLVLDTIQRNDDNQFIKTGEEKLPSGVYLLLLSPTNKYIQFLINDEDQDFEIKLDTIDLTNPTITGSIDNTLFLEYIDFLNAKGSENEKLISQINLAKENNDDFNTLESERNKIDQQVKSYQKDLLSNHPKSITSILIKSTMEVELPEFEGTENEIKEKRYYYYKQHYFDQLDLGDPTLLRTPFLHNKIVNYVEKLTPQTPDSINYMLDLVLGKMENAPETFRFYLSHFLNTYAKSKIVGFDAIYVHLVDNYYAQGKADWVDQESLDKIIAEANKLRPTLIGRYAPEIKVYQKDGTPISITDITSKYLILYFWAPDCGHCTKSTPHIIDFYEKYKEEMDVEILAVCTKHQDKEPSCWEAVEEKGMDLWINASDVNHLSRFKVKYNVATTPSIYILNENREIIMKRIGAEYLEDVMKEIIRVDELKANENQPNK